MAEEVHKIVHDKDKEKDKRYGMNQIAYTPDPAIEVMGFYFSNDEEKERKVLSEAMQEEVLNYLENRGASEEDRKDWEEIDEEQFNEGRKIKPGEKFATARIKPDSILDRVDPDGEGMYILRYEYMGPLDSKNRSFCSRMLLRKKMYSYEDINTELSNSEFGNYSIFDYKGSYGCRHTWERRYFFVTDKGVTNKVGANPFVKPIANLIDRDARTLNARLSKVDTYKMRVAAPALVPDKKIYRKDEDGHEFFVVFTTEEIENLVTNFQGKKVETQFNVNHTDTEAPSYILESWIIESEEDKAYSKYKFKKEDVPIGSWMIVSQVTDEKFFVNEIIEKKQYGYSVEGMFDLDLELKKQKMAEEKEIQKFELDGKFYKNVEGKLILLEEDKKEEMKDEDKKEELADDKKEDKKEEMMEDPKDKEEEMADEPKKDEEVKAEEHEGDKKEEMAEGEDDKPSEEGEVKTYTKEEIDEKVESLVSMVAELEAKITQEETKDEELEEDKEKESNQYKNQKTKGIAATFAAMQNIGK